MCFLKEGGIWNKTLPDCNGMDLKMDYMGGWVGGTNTESKDNKSFKFT